MNVISTILDELRSVCHNISKDEYEALVLLLNRNHTFYFAGEGRSGLVAKTIAMRLMHAGKKVYVVGETITPAIERNDVLILVSGSGETNQIVHLGKQASKKGAYVFLVTANKNAMKQRWCMNGLHIPAATKRRLPDEPKTIQPLGNQFDQAVHVILDAAIIESLQSNDITERMAQRHSNLE